MKNNKFVLGLLLGLTFFLLMGAFTRDWTESTPTDSTVANQIDDYNRYVRVDTSDRLKNMFYGFIAGENTLLQHAQYIQIYEQASVSTPSAAYGRFYGKAVGGKCELHWKDEDGDELQLTTGGDIGGGHVQLLAGMDLLGSATSDITINTNKFTVAGATGNTVIAGTLDVTGNIDPTTYETTNGGFLDEDDMASDSATKVASQQSIKAFVGNCTLNGTQTTIHTKYLTGTLDSDSSTSVAHGCTVGQILRVTVICYDGTASRYMVSELFKGGPLDYGLSVQYDATNIVISPGTDYYGEAYRIGIDYY